MLAETQISLQNLPLATEIITAITGIFGSYIIQAIKKASGVDNNSALLLTGIVSVLLGILIGYMTDAFSAQEFAKNTAIVFTLATLTYKQLLQSKVPPIFNNDSK